MSRVPDDLARGCRQAQLIGVMLLVSLGSCALVIETIRAQRAPFTGFVPAAPLGLLRPALVLMAVLGLLAAGVVRRQVIARRAAASSAGAPLVARLTTATIVTLALCEAIAIYGFVLFLLGGHRADFYGFLVFSLVGFAVYFPRLSLWEDWARRA